MIQMTSATVYVNDEAIVIEANTLRFTEGKGQQTMRSGSVGGGETEPIYSKDVSQNISTISFDLPGTPENIALALTWKTKENTNTCQIAGSTSEGNLTRTQTQGALLNDYEVQVSADGVIPIVFSGNPLI